MLLNGILPYMLLNGILYMVCAYLHTPIHTYTHARNHATRTQSSEFFLCEVKETVVGGMDPLSRRSTVPRSTELPQLCRSPTALSRPHGPTVPTALPRPHGCTAPPRLYRATMALPRPHGSTGPPRLYHVRASVSTTHADEHEYAYTHFLRHIATQYTQTEYNVAFHTKMNIPKKFRTFFSITE